MTATAKITTLSSREFQQNAAEAQKAARAGPVFITMEGEPECVLLSIEEYRRMAAKHRSIVDALSIPGLSDTDLEIPPRRDRPRPAELDD